MNLIYAKQLIDFAVSMSIKKNLKICIAVYDESAHLLAFERMDKAMLGSIDLAFKKAKTSCLFKIETQELGKLAQPNMPAWSIQLSNENLTTIAGGIPIYDDSGELYGSIGISGGTASEDYEIASECVNFIKKINGIKFI